MEYPMTRTAWVAVALCALVAPAVAVDAADTYSYDFSDGAAGWSLDDNWTLTTWDPGGQALLGDQNGIAIHTEGSGTLRTMTLRFQMDQDVAFFCLSIGGPGGPAGLSYSVCIEDGAIAITSRQNEATEELAFVPFSTEGGLPHTATVHTGGGSLDVFIDDVGVVGVDAVDPAAGSVSLLAGPESVIVDDVVIVLGGDGAGHPRAPRPLDDVPPGPDVGPFVNGELTGDLTLSGTDELVLSGGRYVVTDGNISVTEQASLVVASDGVLAFGVEDSPLIHFGVGVSDDASFRIEGGRILPSGEGSLIFVSAFGRSTVELSDCEPWIHILQAEGSSSVVLDGVRLVTSIGGQVAVAGNATVDITHSVLSSIGINLSSGATLRAAGLDWGRLVDDFDLRRDLDVAGVNYDLRLEDVLLHPSLLTDGANEKGWIVAVDSRATLEVDDSEIGKLNLTVAAGADEFRASNLRIAEPADFAYRGIALDDVSVTQQWGLFIEGTRRAIIEDSEGVWLFLFDTVEAVLRRSTMSEFDPREYTGTVIFDQARWESAACEILDHNDFTMRGSVTTLEELTACAWSDSTMTRLFDVRYVNATGDPIAGAELTASRGDSTVTATTDAAGTAVFSFVFDDEDRLSPWTISGPDDAEAMVDAFSSNPVTLAVPGPVRVRHGGRRVSP